MARPTREEINTFMAITGASESLALQKLMEHDGLLFEAVNAFYVERENQIFATDPPPIPPPPAEYPEDLHQNTLRSNNNETQSRNGLSPIFAAVRSFKPSMLLDPNYRRDLRSRISVASSSLLSPQGQASTFPAQPNDMPEHLPNPGPRPTVGYEHLPMSYRTQDEENRVDDEIILAVIRESLRDSQVAPNTELSLNIGHSGRRFHEEDDDLARAVSLSLETAEKEEALREQQMRDHQQGLGIKRKPKSGSTLNRNEVQNIEEQQVRENSSHTPSDNLHPLKAEATSKFQEPWDAISPEEIDEALLLETAVYGLTPVGTTNDISKSPLQSGPEPSSVFDLQPIRRSMTPSHQESRLLKEQQDKEYEASLLLDKQKQEDSHQKMLNEVEQERTLAVKRASLLSEPAADDENAVSLLVRMPDGNRPCRRFLKSDKLQLLFDFIDIGGEVKPGTYRMVRHFPRREFNLNESSSTLSELGLTNKQEVLYLERLI